MEKIAWIMEPDEVPYYSPIMECFKGDEVDIYLGVPRINSSHSSEFVQQMDEKFRMFAEKCKKSEYACAVVSKNFFYNTLKHYSLNNIRCIALTHAADAPFSSGRLPAHYYIASSRRQAETLEDSKFARSTQPQLFEKLMTLPMESRNEYAYSGPYHLGEWAKKRHLPKTELQQELAETCGCSFDAHKPVVAFLQDEFCHPRQVIQALGSLAGHVNLVIKALDDLLSSVPGAFQYPSQGFAPNLLRFAADYILAGYHSGTLASSTMLGLSVIPYYTTLIYKGGRNSGSLARYTAYLESQDDKDVIGAEILTQLNPPINLQDTEAILVRMHDDGWWTEYQRRLPAVQKNIFGDYDIDHAAEKTAELIRRVASEGTFGELAAAARLRPEVGRIVKGPRPAV